MVSHDAGILQAPQRESVTYHKPTGRTIPIRSIHATPSGGMVRIDSRVVCLCRWLARRQEGTREKVSICR